MTMLRSSQGSVAGVVVVVNALDGHVPPRPLSPAVRGAAGRSRGGCVASELRPLRAPPHTPKAPVGGLRAF